MRAAKRLIPARWSGGTPAEALAVALLSTLFLLVSPARSAPTPAFARHGVSPMLEPHNAALLVDYFDRFLRDQDIEGFRRSVQARYNEGTLGRLAESGGTKARRAAVLALGLLGEYSANSAVGERLRDSDPVVRDLALNALWAIWFRADTPENNRLLEEVRDLINHERLNEAVERASALIERAPNFAEAYNQRAIALFFLNRFADSAEDCRQALQRNPYHVGALAGLGKCYMELGRREDALATYLRALQVQPYDTSLQRVIATIEASGD